MKYWISTSGGIASAISAIIAHENGLEYEMIFADTLGEHWSLYKFIVDVQIALNKPIIWLKDGRTIWDVFIDEKYIGNSRIAPCSKILKTRPIKEYLKQHAEIGDALILGMDYSELDRIERAEKVWSPRPVKSLLNQYKCYRPQWDAILKRYGLEKPLLYEEGFPHNNCAGACVRAGLKQWATLLERFPEEFEKAEKGEEKAIKEIGPTAKPFLSFHRDKVEFYVTLAQFRVLMKHGFLKIEPFDFGGCGCFTDD